MLLGFIEKLIPAFFVHWNNRIQKQKEDLEIKLRMANYQIGKHENKDKTDEEFSDKSDIDTIDDFLSDPKSTTSQPDERDATK